MTAERAALREEAVDHGDDLSIAEQRVHQGKVLLAERFGGAAPEPDFTTDIDFDAIQAEASAEASRLWSRMANL
jgi:hypothetical protein